MNPAKTRFIATLLFFALTQASFSQNRSIPAKIGVDVVSVVRGTGHVLASPFRWDKKQWAAFGAVMAGTAALSFLDEDIRDFVQRHQNRTFDEIAELGSDYGEPMTVIVLTGGLYGVGLLAGNDWLRETCVILTASLIPAGGYQTASAFLFGRARPSADRGARAFEPFRYEEPNVSFFSGHTLVAFATSHAFAHRSDNFLFKSLLYAGGASTAFARVYKDSHWLTDVSLGAVVAILSVNSASKLIKKRKEKSGGQTHRFGWAVHPWNKGAQVQMRW